MYSVLIVLAFVLSAKAHEATFTTVQVRAPDAKTLLGDELRLRFQVGDDPVNLRLRRTENINPEVPVFNSKGEEIDADTSQLFSAYSDPEMDAHMVVKSLITRDGNTQYDVHGLFQHNGNEFEISRYHEKKEEKNGPIDKRSIGSSVVHRVTRVGRAHEKRLWKRTYENPTQYHITLTLAADHFLFERHGSNMGKLKYYLVQQFVAMDRIYKSVDIDIRITLWLKNFQVFQTASVNPMLNSNTYKSSGCPVSQHCVIDSEILSKLQTYKFQNNNMLDNPDHYMFWTGVDLSVNLASATHGQSSVAGKAPKSGLCSKSGGKDFGVSVNEGLTWHSYRIGAHEVAHNAGGNHDEENECTSNNFVMSASAAPANKMNFYRTIQFSECTKNQFATFLSSAECAKDVVCSHHESLSGVSFQPPGITRGQSHQCKEKFGSSSKKCPSIRANHNNPALDQNNQCSKAFCLDPNNSNSCLSMGVLLQGTRCGKGRRCQDARCVPQNDLITPTKGSSGGCESIIQPAAPRESGPRRQRNDECQDNPGVDISGQSCAEFFSTLSAANTDYYCTSYSVLKMHCCACK